MKLKYLENYLLSAENYSSEERRVLQVRIRRFKVEFKRKWLSVSYREELFKQKYSSWLQGLIEIPLPRSQVISSSGRPLKSFNELSERSKRRRTEDLRRNTGLEELTFATHSKLRESGLLDASAVLQEITNSPEEAQKYRKLQTSSGSTAEERSKQLTTLKALSMFVDADLSREQYEIIRTSDKKLFPSYSILQQAKKQCYPRLESYNINAAGAEINLQDLLDHTAIRLALSLGEKINDSTKDESKLELITKWGCDGSKQIEYKQKFENEMDTDSNIFQSSLVPLQLKSCSGKII